MVGSRRADSRRPYVGEDTRDKVGTQGRADIPPCAGAFHRDPPRSHVAEVDIPEEKKPRHPPGEIHHGIRGVEEEGNRMEAAVLPAYKGAFVRPGDHRRVAVVVAGGVL